MFQLGQRVIVRSTNKKGVIVTDLQPAVAKDMPAHHYVCFFNSFDDTWGRKRIEPPVAYCPCELSPA